MSNRPANWLPDPAGRGFDLRYWDGSQWTPHVTKAGAQSEDPDGVLAAKWAEAPAPSPVAPDLPAAPTASDTAPGAARGLSGKGIGGQLTVDGEWITISRQGLNAKISHGAKGDKRIPISSVQAVQFKKPGIANGYIQFSMGGYSESKGGVMDATKDENSVVFTSRQASDFEAIRDYVEAVISRRMSSAAAGGVVHHAAAAPTLGSQLKELAELRDAGILSDAEFETQKAKLLG